MWKTGLGRQSDDSIERDFAITLPPIEEIEAEQVFNHRCTFVHSKYRIDCTWPGLRKSLPIGKFSAEYYYFVEVPHIVSSIARVSSLFDQLQIVRISLDARDA